MPLDEGEGISESQVMFYDIAGHNHNGVNSTQIDFSAYNILDIIDIGQLRDIIMGTVNNSTLSPNMLQVGFAEGTVRIDGAAPSTVTNLTASASASTTSDGNSFIDVSWVGSTNDSINRYVIELHKSETGISGTYVITRSHETTALSHRFERIDTNAGDVGNIYYKVIVYAISPVGVYSVAATTAGIAPAVNTTAPANSTFNDDYAAFDEGVKPAFKGIFVYLDDNTEFDVKELRGRYEYQVSVNKTSFDTSANLKASGMSKSTYFLVNNLEVRASAGGSKINYYLRIRAINSSGTASTWVYYKNTADGGANGVGTTTASAASAINVLEIDAGVDVQANTITANEIFAGTITATEIGAGEITGDNLNSITINASRYIQSPDFATGTDGWRIEGDGNAEFSEATIRGVIYANTGRLGGDDGWVIASDIIQSVPSAANAVHLNSGGGGSSSIPYLRMGAKTGHDNANTGVWLDPTNGLVLGSGTTGAWIKPDGKFYLGGTSGSLVWDGSALLINGGGTFTGALSAATGTFAGALSAATGTFAGALSAATGTFSGTLTSSVVVSGSIDIGGTDTTSWHVDSDGNMWWGNGGSYAAATVKISNTGDIDFTSGTFSGEVAAGTLSGAITSTATITGGAFSTGSGAFTVSSAGAVAASNLAITGGSMTLNSGVFSVTALGQVTASNLQVTGGSMYLGDLRIDSTSFSSGLTGGGVNAPFYVSSAGLMSFGVNGGAQLRIQPSNQSFIWNGTALEFADSPTSTSTHGFIQGDSATITLFGSSATFEGVTMGACEENYVGVFKVWGTSDNYGIVLSATQDGEDVILLNADQGIRITDNVPSTKTGKLYADSGQLWWNNIRLDTSGGTGDITDVTVTAPITGGGTNGSVGIGFDDAAYMKHFLVKASGTSGTAEIGPTAETLTLTASTNMAVTRSGNAILFAATDTNTTYTSSDFNHDSLTGFVANEHIDWTQASAGTIHSSNYTAGGVTFPIAGTAGSQAAPTYGFGGNSNDSHTGMWSPGDNQVAIGIGNSLRMAFNSTGIHGNYTYYSTGSMIPSTSIYYNLGQVSGTAAYWNFAGTYRQVTHGSSTSGDLVILDSSVIKLYGSSERHKDNITTIVGSDALARIKALRPVEFTWKPGPDDDIDVKNDYRGFSTHRGFIAEEIAAVDQWYATYNWWKSDDPESDDYRRRIDDITMDTPNPTDEQVDEYYDLSEAKPMAWKWDSVITDLVSVVQNLEARLAALEA